MKAKELLWLLTALLLTLLWAYQHYINPSTEEHAESTPTTPGKIIVKRPTIERSGTDWLSPLHDEFHREEGEPVIEEPQQEVELVPSEFPDPPEIVVTYLTGDLSANDVANQMYFVARGKYARNVGSWLVGESVAAVLINRPPGKTSTTMAFETAINNDYTDGIIESKQLSIFRSGNMKRTGMLIETFRNHSRSPRYTLWLPALRKIRRFDEPDQNDAWGESVFTFGEVFMRRAEDDTHELLGESVFDSCLKVMEIKPEDRTHWVMKLPKPQCAHKGRSVYVLKSTRQKKAWWYDYYRSEIDKESFATYRVVYFKNDEMIKTVYTDWKKLENPDHRAVYPVFSYGIFHGTGAESMLLIPPETVALNKNLPESFWSKTTLRKIGR